MVSLLRIAYLKPCVKLTTEACEGSEDQNNLVRNNKNVPTWWYIMCRLLNHLMIPALKYGLMGFSFKFICESFLQLSQKLIIMISSGVACDKENNDGK